MIESLETWCMHFAFLILGVKALAPCSCSFTLPATDCLKPVSLMCVPLKWLEIHSHWSSRFLKKCQQSVIAWSMCMDDCGQCRVCERWPAVSYKWLEFIMYGLSLRNQQLMRLTWVKCSFCNIKIVRIGVFMSVMLFSKTAHATAHHHVPQDVSPQHQVL